MYLSKIALILYSFALHVYTSYCEKPLYRRQYDTKTFNGLPDDHSRCLCSPKGQLPTVQQLLDPQNNGQERVVIYLYKNIGSNEIKIFTPNLDKQLLIPDITYDSGDTLVPVITEDIVKLFHSSPRIKVYNDRFENLRPADSLPIGLNVGTIEHLYPYDVNYINPYNNENSVNKFSVDIISNEDKVKVVDGPYKKNIEKVFGNKIINKWPIPEGETGNVNSETIDQQRWSHKIKYPYRNPQVQHKPDPIIGGDDYGYTFKTNSESYVFPSNSKLLSTLKINNNPVFSGYVTFNVWFTKQMKRFENIHLPHDIKFIDYNVLRALVQKTLLENNMRIGSDNVIRDSKGVVVDAANLELRPMLIGETIDHQILKKTLTPIILPKHMPYLEGILVTLVNPPLILGIIPLGKTLITQTHVSGSKDQLDILNSSKIYLYDYSEESFLDTNGETSSSYSYPDTGIEPVYSHSYKNVYSEPSYSYSGNIRPYWDVSKEPSGKTEVTYWSNDPYTSVSQEPYEASSINSFELIQPVVERRKLVNTKIKHYFEAPKSKIKKKVLPDTPKQSNKTAMTEDISKEETFKEPFLNGNLIESGRQYPLPSFKGIMNTLLYLLNDSSSRRDNTFDSNSTEVDILNESENMNAAEGPDFRIIGGNAATGSGTPLSNKGRSGYN